jgi:hypothetical protein
VSCHCALPHLPRSSRCRRSSKRSASSSDSDPNKASAGYAIVTGRTSASMHAWVCPCVCLESDSVPVGVPVCGWVGGVGRADSPHLAAVRRGGPRGGPPLAHRQRRRHAPGRAGAPRGQSPSAANPAPRAAHTPPPATPAPARRPPTQAEPIIKHCIHPRVACVARVCVCARSCVCVCVCVCAYAHSCVCACAWRVHSTSLIHRSCAWWLRAAHCVSLGK